MSIAYSLSLAFLFLATMACVMWAHYRIRYSPGKSPGRGGSSVPIEENSPPVLHTAPIAIVGGVTLVLAAQWWHLHVRHSVGWHVAVLDVAGIALFLAGGYMANRRRDAVRVPGVLSLLGLRWWAFLAGPALALLAAWAAGDSPHMRDPSLAVLSWLTGITLVMVLGWRRGQGPSLTRRDLIIGLVMFVLALAVRAVAADKAPPVLTGDEASSGLSAIRFLEGKADNIFTIGWFSFPALFYSLQAVFIAMFGRTVQALRYFSALAGALTVGAVYWLGEEMYDRRTGLLAALFLAGFHFHLHFSRIGLNNVWDGLFFVLTLWAMWDGWKNDRRGAYLLAGLFLGLGQYFYVSMRVLPALILAWLLIAAVLDRDRLKNSLPHLLWMACVFVVTVLPSALFFAHHPNEFMAPMNRVRIWGPWIRGQMKSTGLPAWKILLHQFWLSLGAFTQLPSRQWYDAGVPILRPVSAAIFLLGVGLLVARIRDIRSWIVGLWLLAFAVSGALSTPAPASQRYVAAAPACALVFGYALSTGVSWMARVWPEHERRLVLGALALTLVLAADDVRFYFKVYTPRSNLGGTNTLVANRLASYLQEEHPGKGWEVLFFGAPRMGYYSISTLSYLVPGVRGTDMNHAWKSGKNPRSTGSHLIFVFLPGHEQDMKDVMRSYPGGRLREEREKGNRVLYWVYEVVRSGTG